MANTTAAFLPPPIRRLVRPFAAFVQMESSSSIVLLTATVIAFAFANSRFNGSYQDVLKASFGAEVGTKLFSLPLLLFINDVLMTVFFLVVGLEVKREFVMGELASFEKATLPVIAAFGGMLVPALVYLGMNHSHGAPRGWGVPIATDIAFSLAVLTAFGRRIPLGLRVFLASLAIADDIGGVVVIAVAYSEHLHIVWLFASALLALLALALNRMRVSGLWGYLAIGLLLWVTLHAAGIHPTLAGVVLALAIPARGLLPADHFVAGSHSRLKRFHRAQTLAMPVADRSRHLERLKVGLTSVQSPLDRLESHLHPWVSYGIMPLFALANAGIPLHGLHFSAAFNPAFSGIVLGLLLGKPIGITAFSWLAVKLRVAELPRGVSWRQLHAAGWVAGIGFTVAIFIAGLAFGAGELYSQARLAIVLASTCAALIGATLLHFSQARDTHVGNECAGHLSM